MRAKKTGLHGNEASYFMQPDGRRRIWKPSYNSKQAESGCLEHDVIFKHLALGGFCSLRPISELGGLSGTAAERNELVVAVRFNNLGKDDDGWFGRAELEAFWRNTDNRREEEFVRFHRRIKVLQRFHLCILGYFFRKVKVT